MKVRLLLFLVFWNIVSINAQVKEHFQSLEAWKVDTAQWKITDEILQSNYKIINSSFDISTTNTLVTNCVWKLNVVLKFSTSSLNYVDFYLLADTNDFSKTQKAYFVRIGSTSDDICLYKKENATSTKLIDGADGRSQTSSTYNQIQLKVIRKNNGEWCLLTDNESNGKNYLEEGKCLDSTFVTGKYTGIQVHQSTASFVGKHFFDDLIIETIAEDSLENNIPTIFPAKGDMVLSEILFNPLPNGVDFVEIYNRTDNTFSLSDLVLANEKGDTINFKTSKKLILPKSHLVLCIDSNNIHQNYTYYVHKNIVQVSKIPSMNDDAGHIALLNSDKTLLDELTYSEAMHYSLIANPEGVSLEKINLNETSEINNWHSASSTVGFATPGNINSQNIDSQSNSSQFFSISSKVFSPNEDGNNDVLLMMYSVPKLGTTASIYIFNTAGEIVKQLANNHLLSTNGVYQWDGTTAKGEKAQNGYYLIRVEMLNSDGKNDVAEIPVVLWVD